MPTGPDDHGVLVGVLAVVDGSPRDALFALYEGENTIGTSLACDVVVDAPGIAPRHARLVCEEGAFALLADDDEPMVFVNAEPIDACELADGDVLRLGATTLRFRTLPGL